MIKCKKTLLVMLISVALVFTTVFAICLVTNFKFYYYLETRPDSQKNTKWRSDDGQITLYIGENNNQRIIFEQEDGIFECYFTSERGYCANVYAVEALNNNRLGLYPEEHYEVWFYTKVKEDSFTITVEKTKFLHIGEKITFRKINTGKTGDGSEVRQGTVLCSF